MEKKYYVYVHKYASGPKVGRVFYVGKGKKSRYNEKHNRSSYWHRVVEKYGFTAHIVIRFLNEACALSFEKALIKHYGRPNLCNLTDGGDGVSGLVFTEQHRAKISATKSGVPGKPMSEENKARVSERMSGKNNHWYGKTFSEDHKRKLSETLSGRKLSQENIEGIRKALVIADCMAFFHEENAKVAVCSGYEMHTSGALSRPEVSQLRHGARRISQGWVLLDG